MKSERFSLNQQLFRDDNQSANQIESSEESITSDVENITEVNESQQAPVSKPALKENEWECDFCETVNQFQRNDPQSCSCINCDKANLDVYMMIANYLHSAKLTESSYIWCPKCCKEESFSLYSSKCYGCYFHFKDLDPYYRIKDGNDQIYQDRIRLPISSIDPRPIRTE